MRSPKVSIGLPVFNGQAYLKRSIVSILQQDYEDLELIISDNASTDETESLCREFARTDPRVRYYRNDVNIGFANNTKRVFDLARGEFFKWAHYDDECHTAMIGRCVQVLESAPKSVTMVYPLAELIDEEGRTLAAPLDRIESKDTRPHRRLAHVIQSLSVCDPLFGLMKTEYLRRTRLLGPFFGADNVLLAELAMLGQIWEVNEVLFRLRQHPKRSVKANTSVRSLAVWYDPVNAGKLLLLPNWERMVWELMKSVSYSSLSPAEKSRCYLVVPGVHYWRRFKNVGGRIKRRLNFHIHM
jgi:glycosyltransferase involved in cell wall biosynthesis